MTNIEMRIDSLDDKQSIHIVKKLVESAFNTAPFQSVDEDELRERMENATGLASGGEDEALPTHEAGEFARQALKAMAETPDGAGLVTTALDSWFDGTADFGLLRGSIAIAMLWLVAAPDIEFTVGTFHYRKAGLTGAQQVSVTKVLTPALSALLPPKNPGGKSRTAAKP